ncbi:hypothetical protein B0T17DRAFT_615001 [Bombardia bombarda]|uniref:Uncharacterized protein n=1 Tax=Bombardia bombarda TaxID=252184 RepID=A0AA39X8C7_9PEZI|nr:hypothetical protein B0T17DRAFT_615001 [Bombardia bombarda]
MRRSLVLTATPSHSGNPRSPNRQVLSVTELSQYGPTTCKKEYHPEVDVDHVWVDLCRGDGTAIQYCKAFLQLYVENSTYMRVVLGPEEEVEDRAIKSSRSLNTFWKSLIAAADAEVLLPKRQDPKNHWMTLKRQKDHPGSTDEGPVLPDQPLDLPRGCRDHGTYRDARVPESRVHRQRHRPHPQDPVALRPSNASSFTLSSSSSPTAFGIRQGMIMGMKYRDVTMAVIRDDQDRRRLVATFTIWRNKLRANALGHKKGEKFQFTTTLLPYQLFCVTHLVGVIGVHFNAFKAGYRSVDELLHRPNLEHVDYVPLEWRDEVLDDDIFPMSYTTFSRILHHVLLVAGFQTMARIYAFRLGALVEYDGSLTQAVGELMRLWTGEAGFGNRSESSPELVFDDRAEDRAEKAMAWLLCYAETDRAVAEATETTEEKRTSTSASTSNSICLLCDKSYALRRSLIYSTWPTWTMAHGWDWRLGMMV